MIHSFCKKLSELATKDLALVIIIVSQVIWISIGQFTRRDPYPFIFMLTVSNVVQLIMMFVIANAQRSQHAEMLCAHKTLHKRIAAITPPKKKVC